jgi:general secretion pathway protein A
MYDQFYGLSGRPFQLTPDPHFYFESATHRKALSYLGYGLAQGEGFIVITGDIGAGKTTLVGHVMGTVDPARLTAAKIVSTQVGGGLSAEGQTKAQLLQRIEAFLHAQARAGKRSLLIVDEAQNLAISAIEELRMLSNFQLGGQALLQIFLLGQPEFRDLLKSPELEQLRQRVIATHHLEPMLESEIEPYVLHRLRLVGWEGNPQFTADAFAALYAATDGVPRRVNVIASRLLLLGAMDQLGVIDADTVAAVLADMGQETEEPAVVAPSPMDRAAEPSSVPAPDASAIKVIHAELDLLRTELAEAKRALAAQGSTPDSEEVVEVLAYFDKRLDVIDARSREQDTALRRVLTLLVDWVERDEQAMGSSHSQAA